MYRNQLLCLPYCAFPRNTVFCFLPLSPIIPFVRFCCHSPLHINATDSEAHGPYCDEWSPAGKLSFTFFAALNPAWQLPSILLRCPSEETPDPLRVSSSCINIKYHPDASKCMKNTGDTLVGHKKVRRNYWCVIFAACDVTDMCCCIRRGYYSMFMHIMAKPSPDNGAF